MKDYCLYYPKVNILLMNQSGETVQMLYDDNAETWSMPLIGPRPPYYTNPRYTPYYPVI